MKSDKRKINKIYSQIDKIATKGKDNYLEYCQYVDDCISRSDYDNFLQCLYYFYSINIDRLNTVEDTKKKKIWELIRLNTNTSLSKRIKRLYDSKNVYQTSFDIYSDTNQLLGTIVETDDINNEESKYYIKNKIFSKIMKTRKNFEEVKKVSATQSVVFKDYDYSISDDENMYNKYVMAINLLTS